MQDQENETKSEEELMEHKPTSPEVSQQEPNTTGKKGIFSKASTRIALIIAVVVIAIGGLAVGLVRADIFTNPEKAIDTAMESLVDNTTSEFESVFGLTELYQKILEKGMEYEMSLSMEDIPGDLFDMPGYTIPKAGLSMRLLSDSVNKRDSLSLGLQIADTTLLDASVFADDKEIILSAPQLIGSLLSLQYTDENFIDNMKNSYLSSLLGIQPEVWDEVETAMNMESRTEETEQLLLDFSEDIKESVDKLNASRVTEKVEAQLVNVDGKDVKCKGYKAVYDEENVITFLSEIMNLSIDFTNKLTEQSGTLTDVQKSELTDSYQELETVIEEMTADVSDVELVIYTYNKRIAQMELTTEVNGYETKIEANFSVKGNAYDNMEAKVQVETAELDYEVKLTHTTENTDEELSSVWKATINGVKCTVESSYDKLSGDFFAKLNIASMMQLELTGVVSELKKGEEIAVEVENLSYTENGVTESLPIELEFSISALDEEITAPSGEKKDVVAMTEDDWNTLVMEVYMNIFTVLSQLSEFIQ